MASMAAAKKSVCVTCEKNTGIFTCGGCNRAFCTKHANEHRQILGQQMDEIVFEHDQLRHNINEQTNEANQCSSIKEIDEWERQSIDTIYQIARNAREKLNHYMTERTEYLQTSVEQLREKLNKARIEDDFVETDLQLWSDKINKLKFDVSTYIPIFFKSIDDDLIRFISPSQDDRDDQANHPLFMKVNRQNNHPSTGRKRESISNEGHSHPRVVELPKTAEGLGFIISSVREQNCPIYISHIVPNGIAWKHGGLKIGDQLLSVNDVSVENEDHTKAVELIQRAHGWVKLVVRYSSQDLTDTEHFL